MVESLAKAGAAGAGRSGVYTSLGTATGDGVAETTEAVRRLCPRSSPKQ
jgi:hypothetical protein